MHVCPGFLASDRHRSDVHACCRNIMRAVDNVLRNVKPPIFSELKMHSLKFGTRAPEFVTMRTFSVSAKRIVIHARMRFVGTDLQATVLGVMPAGKVYAGAELLFHSIQELQQNSPKTACSEHGPLQL